MAISPDNELNVIKDLYINWDKGYWYSVYVFLVIQGLIIVALTDILKASGTIGNGNAILSMLVLSGISFTILWCLVLNRKFSFIYHAQEELKSKLGKNIWDNIEKNSDFKKNFWYFSFIPSSIIVNRILMTGFILFWLIMGYFIGNNLVITILSIIALLIVIWLFWFGYAKYEIKLKK
jgi:hypothetical protein